MNKNLSAFLKGIYAGLAIGLGGMVFCLTSFLMKDFMNPWLKIIPSYLFSIGLILVCFLGLFLCTGRIGFLFNSLLLRDDKETFKRASLDLGFMILGNIVGAVALGLLFGLFGLINADFKAYLDGVAYGKILGDSFNGYMKSFLYSMACGALVYLAILSFKCFKLTVLKIIGIIISIGTFVYFGFFHCVANAFYFAMSISFDYRMITYFLVNIFGNFVGALILNFIILGLLALLKNKKYKEVL